MALIKCKECGGTISDKAATCPHCGAPVEVDNASYNTILEDKAESAPSNDDCGSAAPAKNSNRTIVIVLAVVIVVIIAAIVGVKMTADKEKPVIAGIEKDQVVDVTCGTAFNLNDYVSENIKITDNKDGIITSYKISADEKVYDKDSGVVDTQLKGEYPVKITTQDEADNPASTSFTLKLNPVHITKKNRTPVIYEGEYGKIKLVKFERGMKDGKKGYYLTFKFTNNTENLMEVYLGSSYTYVGDTNVSAYYIVSNGVLPGKKGKAECEIYSEDIPKKLRKCKQIESAASMGIPDGDAFYRVSIVLDTNAAKKI